MNELRGWLAELSSEEEAALYGAEGDGGCTREAQERLQQGVSMVDIDWFAEHDVISAEKSAVEPSVKQAVEQWSRCMADAGYDYAGPSEAIGDPRWDLSSPHVPAEEKAVARADARCKRESDLVDIRAKVETRIQNELIANHPARFAELERAMNRYVANAGKHL